MKYFRMLCIVPVLLLMVAGCKVTDPVDDEDITNYYDIDIGNRTIHEMILSPDGSKVVIQGHSHSGLYGFLEVYDTKTQAKLWEKTSGGLYTDVPVNFSEDGGKLLFQTDFESFVVANSQNGSIIRKFTNIHNARLFPDGSTIVGVYQRKISSNIYNTIPPEVTVYSVNSGDKIRDLSFRGTEGWGPENWELIGTSGSDNVILFNDVTQNNQPTIQITYWNVNTDTKSSNAYFAHVGMIPQYNDYAKIFSPDFSVIALTEDYTKCFFYNTLTGAKINSKPFVSYRKEGNFIHQTGLALAISNDQTFAMIEKNEEYKNKTESPITYSQAESKVIKKLSMPSWIVDSVKKQFFKYSFNSKILAKVISNNEYPHENDNHAIIRIWKVK